MSNIFEITDVNEALALLRRAVEAKGIDSNLGSYYEAEIIEASNPALVGMTASWG